ncbi:TonB-dependent receptor, partial [Vibrio xuii]
GHYTHNEDNGDQAYNGYTNASSEDTTEQFQGGIKHIWQGQSAVADSIAWQLDWLSKEENGVTHRIGESDLNHQRKDYLYKDEGYQFDIQFDKYLALGRTEHYIVYGASYLDKDIENVNKEYNSNGGDKDVFYIPS